MLTETRSLTNACKQKHDHSQRCIHIDTQAHTLTNRCTHIDTHRDTDEHSRMHTHTHRVFREAAQ